MVKLAPRKITVFFAISHTVSQKRQKLHNDLPPHFFMLSRWYIMIMVSRVFSEPLLAFTTMYQNRCVDNQWEESFAILGIFSNPDFKILICHPPLHPKTKPWGLHSCRSYLLAMKGWFLADRHLHGIYNMTVIPGGGLVIPWDFACRRLLQLWGRKKISWFFWSCLYWHT